MYWVIVFIFMDVQAAFVIHKESESVNVIECDGIGLDNKTLDPSSVWHSFRLHNNNTWLGLLFDDSFAH